MRITAVHMRQPSVSFDTPAVHMRQPCAYVSTMIAAYALRQSTAIDRGHISRFSTGMVGGCIGRVSGCVWGCRCVCVCAFCANYGGGSTGGPRIAVGGWDRCCSVPPSTPACCGHGVSATRWPRGPGPPVWGWSGGEGGYGPGCVGGGV